MRTSRDFVASKVSESKVDEDELEDETSAIPSPSIPEFHIDESLLKSVETVVTDVEAWLKEKIGAQENLELSQDPVLLVSDLQRKGDQIQSALRRMLLEQSKPKTKPKKTTSTSTSSTSEANDSSSTNTPAQSSTASSSTSTEPDEALVYTEVQDESETTYTSTATVTSIIIEDGPETTTASIVHEEL